MEKRMARFIQGDRPEAGAELAMTIQLDRRPLVGGSNRGGIKAPSKPFPSFSKSGVSGSKLFQTKL